MLIQHPPYSNCNTEEVTEIPLSFSISIQSDTACFAVAFPLTEPAWLIAPPYKRNFSVNVVLPASGMRNNRKGTSFFYFVYSTHVDLLTFFLRSLLCLHYNNRFKYDIFIWVNCYLSYFFLFISYHICLFYFRSNSTYYYTKMFFSQVYIFIF